MNEQSHSVFILCRKRKIWLLPCDLEIGTSSINEGRNQPRPFPGIMFECHKLITTDNNNS